MDRISYVLILLAAALLLVPGCFAAEQNTTISNATALNETANTTATVAAPVVNATADLPALKADANVTTGSLKINETAEISLAALEDGGEWNASVTDGLKIVNTSAVAENGTSIQQWIVKAVETGANSFTAAEKGKEEGKNAYTLNITVE
jgi:hypothetical protein